MRGQRTGAGALLVVVTLALTGCGDDTPAAAPSPSVAAPTPTTSPSATPTVPPSGTPTVPPSGTPTAAATAPTGAEGGVVLGGADLGVTSLGAPVDQAVQAVSSVLGPPDEDPSAVVRCISADREVRWGDFVLAAREGRVAGWQSGSSTLQTPSGVTVGTPLSALDQVYGDGFERFPANPDNGPSFAVTGVDVLGSLSSEGDDAVVTSLFSSFCGGP